MCTEKFSQKSGWKCDSGDCIRSDWVCDGFKQCPVINTSSPDDSDEEIGCNLYPGNRCTI